MIKVWCDASSLAIGACLEANWMVIGYASWMRKENDGFHISFAELEAVIKGLNMALKWGVIILKVMTDSASVLCWVKFILEDSIRPKVG